jgi:hypothetical protein
MFVVKQIACAFFLHDYELMARGIVRADELSDDLSFTWFTVRQYEYLMLMHTRRYAEALELCGVVMHRSGFVLQGSALRERWQIFLLYAEHAMDRIPVAVSLGQFLKLAPQYSSDKAGFNLSLVVLQMLIEFRAGVIDRAADRLDGLRTYRKRYLGRGYLAGEHGSAPDRFFRLLNLADRYAFDPKIVRRKSAKQIESLDVLDSDPTEEAMYVAPFTVLWEMLVSEMEHAWNMQSPSRQARVRELVQAELRPGRPRTPYNFWKRVLEEEAEQAAMAASESIK